MCEFSGKTLLRNSYDKTVFFLFPTLMYICFYVIVHVCKCLFNGLFIYLKGLSKTKIYPKANFLKVDLNVDLRIVLLILRLAYDS